MSIATARFPFSFHVVSRDVNTTNEEILQPSITVRNDNPKTIKSDIRPHRAALQI
jgi:hypothetical protein